MAEFELDNAGNSEAQQKQGTAYLLAQSSTGLAATGVLSGLAVTQTSTASGSVLIAAGAGVVQASVLAGASVLVNDTQKTLDVLVANPMGGLPRNDIVVFDATTPALTVIVGTPNASPTDPTVPATALPLARLRHDASATTIPTANIDSLIVATALVGVLAPAVSTTRTTNSGPFTTVEGIVSAPAVTGDGAKKFKITASFQVMTGTVAGDVWDFYIKDASTSTIIKTIRGYVTTATGTAVPGLTIATVNVPAAGSHVYNLSANRASGTGTGTMVATATAPIDIVVEQIA